MLHVNTPVAAPGLRNPVSIAVRGSLTRQALRGAMLVTTLAAAVTVAYLAKSALRIDILPGPSPLHDILYPIVQRLR